MHCVNHNAGSKRNRKDFLITKESVCPVPPSSIGFKPSKRTGHQRTRGVPMRSFAEHTLEMRAIETTGLTKTIDTHATISAQTVAAGGLWSLHCQREEGRVRPLVRQLQRQVRSCLLRSDRRHTGTCLRLSSYSCNLVQIQKTTAIPQQLFFGRPRQGSIRADFGLTSGGPL